MYMRISDENNAWLNRQAAQADITKAAAVDIILSAARSRGWEIMPGVSPSIDQPGRPSPAAGHPLEPFCEGGC